MAMQWLRMHMADLVPLATLNCAGGQAAMGAGAGDGAAHTGAGHGGEDRAHTGQTPCPHLQS